MKLTKQSKVVIELEDEEVKKLRNFLNNAAKSGLTSKFDEPLIKEMYVQLLRADE